MSAIHKRAQRATFYLIAVLMGLSLFAPIVALGQGNLNAGDTATISTGGGDATLRDSASSSGASIGSIPNGTEVYIVDGPLTDTDGSMWYQAGIWDITGYISSTLLEGESVGSSASEETTDEVASVETESTSVIPWEQPIDYGVVVDNSNAPLPGDGLACRAAAFGTADVIVRLAQGQSVEVTGVEQWAEGLAFLPVNCGGQGGFVKADYVALDSEPELQVVEETVEEPVATEEVVVEEDVVQEDAATEEPVADAPSAGDLIVRVSDQAGMPVAGLCFQLFEAGTWIADACDSNDAIPDNG
ncbi:MAG: hypothetical protein WKF63_02030, partial [Thermomicrobiales bacterium]